MLAIVVPLLAFTLDFAMPVSCHQGCGRDALLGGQRDDDEQFDANWAAYSQEASRLSLVLGGQLPDSQLVQYRKVCVD